MEKYIEILKKLSEKAYKNGDIPISCIIIDKKGKIIAKAYNKKYKNNDPLGHAEIIAIKKASKKLKTTNLIDCELIVNLHPCKMCQEIIKESRIKTVKYILEQEKEVQNNVKYDKIETNVDNFFKYLIKNFFVNKR